MWIFPDWSDSSGTVIVHLRESYPCSLFVCNYYYLPRWNNRLCRALRSR
jgi:hypothetical protein